MCGRDGDRHRCRAGGGDGAQLWRGRRRAGRCRDDGRGARCRHLCHAIRRVRGGRRTGRTAVVAVPRRS